MVVVQRSYIGYYIAVSGLDKKWLLFSSFLPSSLLFLFFFLSYLSPSLSLSIPPTAANDSGIRLRLFNFLASYQSVRNGLLLAFFVQYRTYVYEFISSRPDWTLSSAVCYTCVQAQNLYFVDKTTYVSYVHTSLTHIVF